MGDTAKDQSGLRLATIKQMPSLDGYGWLTESALRHLVFAAEDHVNSRGEKVRGNGLNSAIIRVGRRVLMDLDAFDRWLDAHRSISPSHPGGG